MPDASTPTDTPAQASRFPLHLQMLAGFTIGLGAGLAANLFAGGAPWIATVIADVTGPIGQVFLRLLFMLVLPLLFAALVTGVAEMGDLASLKRVGLRTIAYTVALSAVSVAIGLLAVDLVRPGAGIDPGQARALLAQASGGAAAIVHQGGGHAFGAQQALAIIPSNVVTAAAQNDILAVMVFALAIGVGVVLVGREEVAPMLGAIDGLLRVTMALIGLVIRLAPIAVACFMFDLAAALGVDILVRLGWYVTTVLGALLVQLLVVYSLGVRVIGGMSPLAFFRGVQEAMVMAFSTASSNATLPTSLRVAEERLHLPRKVSRFVLTIGATANQNGTAIFEGVTVLFLAQVFGVELSLSAQAGVMLICILGGVGTAGVPAGSLPVVAIILGTVGVPPAAIGVVLGVDRFLDMCRSTLNVTGDLAIATMVAGRSEDQRR